ncbi:MAG: hypothetical protein COA58_12275 [Bacteroidetes bacterium]|nr:MAG: hypothetical protein COA58_12275 [Bacteroidota bacterium]
MRLALFALCLTTLQIANAQFTEDFSDGNLSSNPTWIGDIDMFIIDDGQLRSNNNIISDNFYLSTHSTLSLNTEWRINVNMKFSTSGANYTDVYLIADTHNLTLVKNGYFVRLGDTKDDVSLYKMMSGTKIQLTDGTDNQTHNKNISLKVTRTTSGLWTIGVDYNGGTNYKTEGTADDNDITSSSYFGISIQQSTASFHLKHFYDNIYVGPIIVDNESPSVTRMLTTSKTTISLSLNEVIDTSGSSFSLNNGYGLPSILRVLSSGSNIELEYSTPFANNTYELTITNLKDLANNSMDTVVKFNYYEASTPKFGDILINEIFADPTPSIGLPMGEYIEIYNNTSEPLNLENCTLSDGGTPAVFPKIILPQNQYLIVTKSNNESLFTAYGQTCGLTKFPALNNNGDNLSIRNANNNLLDTVSYTHKYYWDNLKQDGGYSIERIDIVSSCAEIDNWMASKDIKGGTPGKRNSVYNSNPDKEAPIVLFASITNLLEITLILNENLISSLVNDLTNFELVKKSINPITISANTEKNSLKLTFVQTDSFTKEYILFIKQLTDCKGNTIENTLIDLVITEPAIYGDIVINELLFNPKVDGVDFIELFNNSDKYIDISSLSLARFHQDQRIDFMAISPILETLPPHSFVAVTSDTNRLMKDYKTESLLQISSLPSMNNDDGTILLLTSDSLILDSVHYQSKQHFDLLSSLEGVSLERLNPAMESNNSNNWHSASLSIGFATPGYQNSQYVDMEAQTSTFKLSEKLVSPDGDGYQDLLTIQYTTQNQGHVINGYVYDLSGRLIHQPFNNETISKKGILTWDAIKNNGTKTPIGNYILLLESFNLEGKVQKKKFAFSIIGRF